MVGMFLKDREIQYTANRDEVTNTWRILNTWHEDLMNLGPEDEVEDTSKAVTILTEGAFISLVKEAARLGVLQNAAFENNAGLEEETHVLKERVLELEQSLHTTVQEIHKSEGFLLKQMAMQTMLKLTSMSDIENLTKE